jgi:hypothetical protein
MRYSTIGDEDGKTGQTKKAKKMLPKADPEGCDGAANKDRFALSCAMWVAPT